jgi:hypothetical protein
VKCSRVRKSLLGCRTGASSRSPGRSTLASIRRRHDSSSAARPGTCSGAFSENAFANCFRWEAAGCRIPRGRHLTSASCGSGEYRRTPLPMRENDEQLHSFVELLRNRGSLIGVSVRIPKAHFQAYVWLELKLAYCRASKRGRVGHSMTASAWARSPGAISKPSAFAVFWSSRHSSVAPSFYEEAITPESAKDSARYYSAQRRAASLLGR